MQEVLGCEEEEMQEDLRFVRGAAAIVAAAVAVAASALALATTEPSSTVAVAAASVAEPAVALAAAALALAAPACGRHMLQPRRHGMRGCGKQARVSQSLERKQKGEEEAMQMAREQDEGEQGEVW